MSLLTVRASLALLFDRGDFDDDTITFIRPSKATQYNAEGRLIEVAENTPRLDYDSVTGELLGILVEESRTNLVDLSYTDTPPTPPPNGYHNGDAFYSESFTALEVSGLSGSYYVRAWAFIPSTYDYTRVEFRVDGDTDKFIAFDDSKRNEWQLVEGLIESVTSRIEIKSKGSGTNNNYYLAGVQVEQGSFPTSYIPTAGSIVTRSADNASVIGDGFTDFYNPEESTFLINAKLPEYKQRSVLFEISEGSIATRIQLRHTAIDTLDFLTRSEGDSNQIFNVTNSSTDGSTFIIAITIKPNEIKVCVNGGAVQTVNRNIATDLFSEISIGYASSTSDEHFNSKAGSCVSFPKALNDADLQILTSELDLT